MSKKYNAKTLVKLIDNRWKNGDLSLTFDERNAVIARLRAAKEYLGGGEEWQGNDLNKAIADYEKGE